ncbi:hypothetical protein P879_10136 [Paragonimus westermani]|uniref:Uncharacterized protein n=1 Tax=Paragonimus westermani TaxID=34504 RepID=A0A8T0DD07_9TREM|nr:hypothetical protein P879_10136 [Paragonimus westermani]
MESASLFQMEEVEHSQPSPSPTIDLGYFPLDKLKELLNRLQILAPTGYIPANEFILIFKPLLEERMLEISGPTSAENVHTLLSSLAHTFQAPFELGCRTVATTVNVVKQNMHSSPDVGLSHSNMDPSKVFYIDWRRFLLATTQSVQMFNQNAKPTQEGLLQLAERLLELDQGSRGENGEPRGPGLVGTKVTRAQFQCAPFPWYLTGDVYYERLHEFVFSIFTKPTVCESENNMRSSPDVNTAFELEKRVSDSKFNDGFTQSKVLAKSASARQSLNERSSSCASLDLSLEENMLQEIDCTELLLYLSTVEAPTPFVGLLRALTSLLVKHVPYLSIPGHENETETQPLETNKVLSVQEDPLVPKIIMEKIVNFGCWPSDPTSLLLSGAGCQVVDAVEPGKNPFVEKLSEIYEDVCGLDQSGRSTNLEAPFSRLMQHPELIDILVCIIERFQLPHMPDPWPTLLRVHFRSKTSGSSMD